MVNYSKWDALELSDDSDIEVHPNVDKRSFIRAKQGQIHMERQQRRLQIETHQYEQLINDVLLQRLIALESELQSNAGSTSNPFETAFQVVMGLVVQNPTKDTPPPRPAGVIDANQPLPTYSKMVSGILDEVKKTLDEKRTPDDQRYEAITAEIGVHIQNIRSIQKELSTKLDELEKKDVAKITSDSYHTGFSSSHVNSSKQAKEAGTSPRVELLNPGRGAREQGVNASSQPLNINIGQASEEAQASAAAKEFASIPATNYRASRSFISSQPQILSESETDGLLIEAFNMATEDQDDPRVLQYIHQGLLLQYCRSLGPNGMAMFFRAIETTGHRAKTVFEQEVAEKFRRIRELAKENALQSGNSEEQIQIHALDSESSIHVKIPPPDSDDEETKMARSIFESFSLEMRAALESGSLDEVNVVLGSMKVPEAEKMVELLGDAGCLSLEENIIDATTEEGNSN